MFYADFPVSFVSLFCVCVCVLDAATVVVSIFSFLTYDMSMCHGAFSMSFCQLLLYITLWNSDSGTACQNPQFSTVLALDKAGSDFLQLENSVSQMCTGKDRRCLSFETERGTCGTSFVLESWFWWIAVIHRIYCGKTNVTMCHRKLTNLQELETNLEHILTAQDQFRCRYPWHWVPKPPGGCLRHILRNCFDPIDCKTTFDFMHYVLGVGRCFASFHSGGIVNSSDCLLVDLRHKMAKSALVSWFRTDIPKHISRFLDSFPEFRGISCDRYLRRGFLASLHRRAGQGIWRSSEAAGPELGFEIKSSSYSLL